MTARLCRNGMSNILALKVFLPDSLILKSFLDVSVVNVLVYNHEQPHVKLFDINQSAHTVTAHRFLLLLQPVVCCVSVG